MEQELIETFKTLSPDMWNMVLAQSKVYVVHYVISIIFSLLFTYLVFKTIDIRDSSTESYNFLATAIILCTVGLTSLLGWLNFNQVITAFYNPNYWALKELLERW